MNNKVTDKRKNKKQKRLMLETPEQIRQFVEFYLVARADMRGLKEHLLDSRPPGRYDDCTIYKVGEKQIRVKSHTRRAYIAVRFRHRR